MFANSWSPRTEQRRACWIWKAEGVAPGIGRSRTIRQSHRRRPMRMLSLVRGVTRIVALAGDTPPSLGRVESMD